jgi:glucokinase
MKKLFIDIGGTQLRSELHDGVTILKDARSSRKNDLIVYIESLLQDHPEIGFIGISYAGQVDNGVILSAPNISVTIKPIKKHFESRYDLRLVIDNDLNCAVMAEAQALNSQSVAALYIGTGTGSAVIDRGELFRGSQNQAFEIGHIPYRQAPFTCGCGKSNCLEFFVSGSGLEKWMRYHHIDGDLSFELLEQSKEGMAIKSQFEEALLFAAATLVTLANPEILVLGGGVVSHNNYLVDLLKRDLPGFAFSPALSSLQIVQSSLKQPGISGARLLQ